MGFTEWLEAQRLSRQWSESELARRAKLSQAIVNHVLTGKRKPTEKFCIAIAHALGESTADVLALGGFETSQGLQTDALEHAELLEAVRYLDDDQRHTLIEIARMMKEGRATFIIPSSDERPPPDSEE